MYTHEIMPTLGALCVMSLHTSIVRVKCLHTYKDYHLQHNEWIGTHNAPNIVYGLDGCVVYGLSYIYNMLTIVFLISLESSQGGRVHWFWFHGVWTCSVKVLEYWMIFSLKIILNQMGSLKISEELECAFGVVGKILMSRI